MSDTKTDIELAKEKADHVNDHHELRAHGCGLDLGHELVLRLGKKMWPNADGMALRYNRM